MRDVRLVSISAVVLALALAGMSFLMFRPAETAIAAPPVKVQICHFQGHSGDFVTSYVGNLIQECNDSSGRLRNVSARSCSVQHAAAPRTVGSTLYTCDGAIGLP